MAVLKILHVEVSGCESCPYLNQDEYGLDCGKEIKEILTAREAYKEKKSIEERWGHPVPDFCPLPNAQVDLSKAASGGYPPNKHRALAQRLHSVLMEHKFVPSYGDFVGGINVLEEELTGLERDGLLKVHEQFYQD